MKKIIILILAVNIWGVSFAKKSDTKSDTSSKNMNTTELVGKVVDFNTGEALVGVEVLLEGTESKVYTDFDGNFSIENIKPGEYNIIASYISYNKSYIEKLNVGNKNNQVNIKLQTSN